MSDVGEDLKEAYTEVGQEVLLYTPEYSSKEYIKLASPVSSLMIISEFKAAWDTAITSGIILEIAGKKYIVLSVIPRNLGEECIENIFSGAVINTAFTITRKEQTGLDANYLPVYEEMSVEEVGCFLDSLQVSSNSLFANLGIKVEGEENLIVSKYADVKVNDVLQFPDCDREIVFIEKKEISDALFLQVKRLV